MIARQFRFHGHQSLNFLFQHGHSAHGEHLKLKFVRNPRRQTARVAVVVSKKIAKSAVKRNRIRRRIFEVVRLNWNLEQNIDLAIVVHSAEILTMPSRDLTAEIVNLLANLKTA
jgi:ribonuclease P protein component